MIKLTEQEIAAFIGRSLSQFEKDNIELLLEAANAELNDLLGGILNEYESDTPIQIKQMLAGLIGLFERQSETGVSSKSVEGFHITFREGSDARTEFVARFSAVIAKYGKSDIGRMGGIRCGRTIYDF